RPGAPRSWQRLKPPQNQALGARRSPLWARGAADSNSPISALKCF
ncbi:hypothetical protein A2U01_0091688, partial [Trifolium medium]|nr:hypothetical protein [Trifolium medium]